MKCRVSPSVSETNFLFYGMPHRSLQSTLSQYMEPTLDLGPHMGTVYEATHILYSQPSDIILVVRGFIPWSPRDWIAVSIEWILFSFLFSFCFASFIRLHDHSDWLFFLQADGLCCFAFQLRGEGKVPLEQQKSLVDLNLVFFAKNRADCFG